MKKLLVAVAGLTAIVAGPALAQNYPTKPITMIVPFAAGNKNCVCGLSTYIIPLTIAMEAMHMRKCRTGGKGSGIT